MQKRLLFLFKSFLFWLLFFLFSKAIFLVYHWPLSKQLPFTDWFRIFYHGFGLDLSAVSYVQVIPCLLLIMPFCGQCTWISKLLRYYNYLLIAVFSFIVVVDLELYSYWGFRLDSTPLMYLNTPKDMLASVHWYVYILFLAVTGLFVWGWCRLFAKVVVKKDLIFKAMKLWQLPIWLFLSACLIIPIRGGFGVAPMNVGTAYFHTNNYANHAAVNVVWNFGFSLTEMNKVDRSFVYMSDEKAKALFDELQQHDTTNTIVLNSKRPNILIVMLESFGAKVIAPLGGMDSVTPYFNKLSEEGILFRNFFASGDRSDKGIVAILSGYPAQPTTSIIRYAQRTQHLPYLTKDLMKLGYSSAFYYGGEIDFANMRSYLTMAGFEQIISKPDFPASTYNSKWGVHDQYVFERLLGDINQSKQPFFKVFFTLSNHEPFDVPLKSKFYKEDKESRFLNTNYYTDKCIEEFVEKARKQPWWNNTLIIFIADHGNILPGQSANHAPEKFHIPMLWVGGAVKQAMKVDVYGSQTDLCVTLLNQLNESDSAYRFSRNLLAPEEKSYAFYAFNKGFGLMEPNTRVVFDHNLHKFIYSQGADTAWANIHAKAYMQTLLRDFEKR